jgi:hypothetical protein
MPHEDFHYHQLDATQHVNESTVEACCPSGSDATNAHVGILELARRFMREYVERDDAALGHNRLCIAAVLLHSKP